jgi:CRP-like cAMP-binding protein
MTTALAQKPLLLTLLPRDVLPDRRTWRLHEGYIRSASWTMDGESITLGLWGPGDVINAEDPVIQPLELQCLTAVVIEHLELDSANLQQHLLAIQRIRAADCRLLTLLSWIARSYGQINRHGSRLSLSELNLTHLGLADLCGLTRVTVTKLLSRFRAEGRLVAIGENDLLIPAQP